MSHYKETVQYDHIDEEQEHSLDIFMQIEILKQIL